MIPEPDDQKAHASDAAHAADGQTFGGMHVDFTQLTDPPMQALPLPQPPLERVDQRARELGVGIRRVLGVDLPLGEPTRLTRFTFHARQVERYRDGRILLAGDAAHVFPAQASHSPPASSTPSTSAGSWPRRNRSPTSRALLIRPDAHIAWAATIDEPTDTAVPALREALSGCFGTPLKATVLVIDRPS